MKSRFLQIPLVFAVLFAGSGCASLSFRPSVQSVGEYKDTNKVTEAAGEMPSKDAEDVKVLIESLPDGMEVKEGAIKYDGDRYEMLGKVTGEYKDPGLVNMGFWAYGYKEEERWRTGLCAWQVPLSWVTLTLWSWLSPTYYPCRVSAGDPEERRAEIVGTLRRATKALGGNLVIVAGFGGVNFVTVNANSGAVVGANSVSNLSGVGYAFRSKNGANGTRSTPATSTTNL